MARGRKRETSAPPPAAYSIPEFCASHRLSRALFYRLLAAGAGPAVMRVAGRRLVSAEAAAAWRRRMEREG
jgi:hypothetical protein